MTHDQLRESLDRQIKNIHLEKEALDVGFDKKFNAPGATYESRKEDEKLLKADKEALDGKIRFLENQKARVGTVTVRSFK